MALKHVLDAHGLIWYQEGNPRLGNNALAIMSDPASEMIVSVIALAEAAYAVE
jgi:PIN domain nuclease of toxin-antitoxin system